MDTQVLLIIGAVIVVGALVVYWQRQGVVKRPSITSQSASPDWGNELSSPSLGADWGEAVGLSQSQVVQINAEIQAKRKINAIKLYREFTNTGLKEAKEAVEAIEHGQKPVSFGYHSLPANPSAGDVMGQIEQELRARRKINAIKLYRETYHVSLKEAKDFVDEMERNLGIR